MQKIFIEVILFGLATVVPCFGIVTGTVLETSGRTVAGARITFKEAADSTKVFSTVTDDRGKFVIDLSSSTGVAYSAGEIPGAFSLGQNYPNPFNPSTVIPFTLSRSGFVTLTVYSITGQRVKTVLSGYMSAGSHTATWKGDDASGSPVSAGVYLCRLTVNGKSSVRKMLLLDGGAAISGRRGSNFNLIMKKSALPDSGKVYTVTITGENIWPFYTKGQKIIDGETYTFVVTLFMTLVSIPGGTFEMGDVENVGYTWEKPVHTVTLSGFEMGAYEITNKQYARYLNEMMASGDVEVAKYTYNVYGKTGPWEGQIYVNTGIRPKSGCRIFYNNGAFEVEAGSENWPVVDVSWWGAKAFALYYGYDLPTEAEWEYACRGGKQYKYGTDDGTISPAKANYTWGMDSIGHPVDVGKYPPNPFGLYDMSGNVWEWCHDWFDDYPGESQTNPSGPEESAKHLFRGGSYSYDEGYSRSAIRGYGPGIGGPIMGFRVVSRVSPQKY